MKIIVFIRSHNDFDHVLPILDYFIREKSQQVEIYGVGNDYKKCSKHIIYLENVLSSKILPFSESNLSEIDQKILKINAKISQIINKFGLINNLFRQIFMVNSTALAHFFISPSLKKFICNLSHDDIVMVDSGTERLFPYKYIIKFSNIRGIPIVSYNHGYDIFTNINPIRAVKVKNNKIIINIINKYLLRHSVVDYCNKYIVGPGQLLAYTKSISLHKEFTEYSRVVEIGLPRFSCEWVERFYSVNLNMVRKPKKIDKKVNVAIFLSNVKFNVDVLRLDEMITVLKDNVNVNLKIVPHTRSGLTGLVNKDDKVSYVTDLSSVEVIQWADLGIVYGSSIAFQMLVSGVMQKSWN